MPKQIMLSDTAYSLLARRKGKRSFSEVIMELAEGKDAKQKDPKVLLELNGIIKTKKKVKWSTEVDKILYGDNL